VSAGVHAVETREMTAPHLQSSPRAVVTARAEGELWAAVQPALTRLKSDACRMDGEAIRSGSASAEAVESFTRSFEACERLLNDVFGDGPGDGKQPAATVGARVRAELLPYMLLSENGERWYSKPRGYAGDYLSIARLYDDQPRGVGRIGPILDRCFLNLAAARAVQNRRALLAREIHATVAATSGRPTRVTSLACGPARELFDVYETLAEPSVLSSTLVDVDLHALAYVSDRCANAKLRRQMTLVHENLVHLVTGRRVASIADQDLVYSVGLIDYFKDDFVVRLMNFAHATLRPGGRVLFGNFHPRNPTKAFMDHVLDWKLVHRTEDDVNRLFAASAFARPASRILYEEQRINLFAECVKA
jgi:extracellular factor (EF) 3-hydroxypalmitic acid methyl ester biosynthesis protein